MALQSGFFNSIDDDRAKNAEFFGKYFASFIGNGVFPNPATNFQVVSNNSMDIIVTKGSGWINGTFCYDKFDYIITLDVADGVLNRIDRVVLRLDTIDRKAKILVKKGEYGTNAVAPELQRDADAYELALADIAVNRGIISITQANITDLRLNAELCGIVHGVVDQVDTTAIFNQFESWYKQTKANYDADIATWTQEKKDDFDLWYTTNVNEFTDRFNTWFSSNTTAWDSEFTTWFDSIKGQLEGDIAANLTAEILELQKTKADKTELALVQEGLGTHVTEKATLTKEGHIRLSSATNSTSETLGATPKAVKAAMDKANSAFQSASNGKELIATAITGKGVTTSSSDTFTKMATNIGNIKVGDYSVGDYIEVANIQGGLEERFTRVDKFYPAAHSGNPIAGVRDVFVDSNNDVYCAVSTDIIKMNSSGGLIWKRLNVAMSDSSNSRRFTLGQDDNLYTVSLSNPKDILMLSKDNGTTIRTFSTSTTHTTDIDHIVATKAGYVYIQSYYYISKFNSSSGMWLWNRSTKSRYICASSSDDAIYTTHNNENSLYRLNSAGYVEWEVSVNEPSKVFTATENKVLLRTDYSGDRMYDVKGDFMFNTSVYRSRSTSPATFVDTQGGIHGYGDNAGIADYTKADSLGKAIRSYSESTSGSELPSSAYSVAAGTDGFVYLAGRNGIFKWTNINFKAPYKILR